MSETIAEAPRTRAGRPTIGEAPMTAAERKRRSRAMKAALTQVEVPVTVTGDVLAFLEREAEEQGKPSAKEVLQALVEQTILKMRLGAGKSKHA